MRIAIISDIHSNLEAVEAMLKEIKLQRIKIIWAAGDIVGYGANPNEVINLLRKENAVMIKGDHDHEAVKLNELSWFNEYAQKALIYTNKVLTDENKAFLKTLKDIHDDTIDNRKIVMVHGSPKDPLHEYVYAKTTDEKLLTMLNKAKSNILIMGHTHQPFVRRITGRLIVNPGSLGQPRDYSPDAEYCILDPKYMQATIHRVKYDIETAAKKIITAGLPHYLADRLFNGR
ncbi:MAG: metallophosphatase family protein [Nanoarchaeota archaeon]|nr:metallophosphatase family protein [Nanoarchaeota archaeon]MCG2717664.1 metallophosphatase family protein [Nanoarchaeota archaeon]